MRPYHSIVAVLLIVSSSAVIPAYSETKPSSRKQPASVVDYGTVTEESMFAKGYVYLESFDRKERLGDACWEEKEKCSCPADATPGVGKIMEHLPKDAAKAGADVVAVENKIEKEQVSKDFKCQKWGPKQYETSTTTKCDPPWHDSRGNYHAGGCHLVTSRRDVTKCLDSQSSTGYQCQVVVHAALYRTDPEMHAAEVLAREKAEAARLLALEKEPIFKGLRLDYKWLTANFYVTGPDGKIALTPDGKATVHKELIVDFTIQNSTQTRLKDVTIECTQYSYDWGSVESTYVVPELQPETTKELKQVNLGKKELLRDQRSCKVKDFTIVKD